MEYIGFTLVLLSFTLPPFMFYMWCIGRANKLAYPFAADALTWSKGSVIDAKRWLVSKAMDCDATPIVESAYIRAIPLLETLKRDMDNEKFLRDGVL